MWKLIRERMGPWFLGALFAVLILEMVLLSPKVLDPLLTEEPLPLSPVSQGETASQVMVGINVVETRDETKEWELWADKAVSQRGQGDLDLEKVRIRFFGPDGIEFLVTGDRGLVQADSKDMQVVGQVVMESSNGYTFQTENMVYSSEKRLLFSPAMMEVRGPPEVEGGRLHLLGQGMEASLIGEKMKILNSVRASKKVPQRESTMRIRSNHATLSSLDKSISFDGAVAIDLDQVKVHGPSARFVYDDHGRKLKALELDGGVRVSDWDKWASAKSVRIDLDKDQYLFKGSPRVVQDADELFGDEILFLDGGRQVKVKNARVRVSKERMEELN